MSFKLLAIRPLERCGIKFLKNLQKNRIYKMYNDYTFYSNGSVIDDFNTEIPEYLSIDKIESNNTLPKDFFGSKVNVSAIIGKNGSGKSSLINLFVAAINQMSIKLQSQEMLETTANLIPTGKDDDSKIHCEFYYQLENGYYIVKIEDGDFEFKTLQDEVNNFDFEKFFYSNVINYSIYGFNSWELGDWIDNLFHKNDSYQIPIVINPKRERKDEGKAGIIDINNENYLLQQRLLSVVLMNKDFEVTQNLTVNSLKLDYKKSKSFFSYSNDIYQDGNDFTEEEDIRNNFYSILQSKKGISFRPNNNNHPSALYFDLDEVLLVFKERLDINRTSIPKDILCRLDIYILYKIISICEKYVSYNNFRIDDGGEKYKRYYININGFIDKLIDSRSHIILKLKQVVNFIKNYESTWKEFLNQNSTTKISIKELSNELIDKSNSNLPLIELLPPAIFETRLFSKNNIDLLDSISSGEMQLVHSTSSVIYHLSNLNSVEKDDMLVKYQYVNLVLDEIELYFHPEYQRKFLKRLLDDINRAKLKAIKGINILIISHSPFVLSDIPSQNVLFLEVNESKESIPKKYGSDNTFAENVHEILSNGFFLNNTMGEFARSKIQDFLAFEKEGNLDSKKLKYNEKRTDFVKLIDLVGEKYISNILKNHLEVLDKKYLTGYNRIEKIQQEIEKLQSEKRRLEDEEN
ncbi:AAA family ATPase [Psychroserpens sp. SPM9]|uniref:AAA family ATPase n=1 Tax=Psychroserpens sp. SPM9 TaxID=2975598 RepID=UPI0021A2E6CB|nr:AAA family ATPase [Psychroserpens sp. SPM9]MDG5492918.1 AAA family ATPase [Psychroserpens sp. SPM9]